MVSSLKSILVEQRLKLASFLLSKSDKSAHQVRFYSKPLSDCGEAKTVAKHEFDDSQDFADAQVSHSL